MKNIKFLVLNNTSSHQINSILTMNKNENPSLIHSIQICDAKGMIISSSSLEDTGSSVREMLFFTDQQKYIYNKILISKPIRENFTNVDLIPLTLRLSDSNGKFKGLIITYLYPHYFIDFFKTVNFGRISIQSIKGYILLGYLDSHTEIIGKSLITNRIPMILDSLDSVMDIGKSDIDGKMRIRFAKKINNSEFFLVCSESFDKINQEIREKTNPILIVSFFISFLILFFSGHFILFINKKIRLEADLRDSENNSRVLINSVSESIVVLQDNIIVFLNPIFLKKTDYNADDLLGFSIFSIVFPEDKEKLDLLLKKSIEHLHINNHSSLRFYSKNKEILWFNFHFSLIHWKNKPSITLTLSDITTHIENSEREMQQISRLELFNNQLENEIRERQLLEVKNAQFIKVLEEKNKEMEDFTYTVSHDLRSPLLTIMGFCSFLKKDIQNNNYPKALIDLEKVEFAAGKMGQLIEDLLEFSRVGKLDKNFTETSVQEIILEITSLLQYAINNANAKIVIDNAMPEIIGDRERIKEVYQNLIDNAIKYRHPDREPLIHIGFDLNLSAYYVKDNGKGMHEDFVAKAFTLFSKENTNSPGSGAGLAIVKKIIDLHKGKVWLKSTENEGSAFYFTFHKDKVSANLTDT